MAYPAALDLATVVLRASGYRAKSGAPGHHENTFAALSELFGKEGPSLTRYFQSCRKKRNTVSYAAWIDISEKESEEFLKELDGFREAVKEFLMRNHPKLAPGKTPGPSPAGTV